MESTPRRTGFVYEFPPHFSWNRNGQRSQVLNADIISALDQMRVLCAEHSTTLFTSEHKRRSVQKLGDLTSKHAMQTLGRAIAYSQGARSASVASLIRSGVLDRVFMGFDHRILAKFSANKILEQSWSEISCIRFRGKVDAILGVATCLAEIDREHGSLASYFDKYRIPRRLRKLTDVEAFWKGFDGLQNDLRGRGMPFFAQTTSLLQLLLDLDFDCVKPDLIIMRVARRIGLVAKETGDRYLRETVWSLQVYSVLRELRAAEMDWYLLSFGEQTEASRALKIRFCPGPGSCNHDRCTIGLQGGCSDY